MFIPPIHLPEVPAVLPGYITVRPTRTLTDAATLAASLGVHGSPRDAGLWYVTTDDRFTLEIYQASDSFRLTRRAFRREHPHAPSTLGEDDAIATAHAFFESTMVGDREWVRLPTSTIEVMSGTPDTRPRERQITGLQINYQFRLDNHPLLGPGAKAQATIIAPNEVGQAYVFWRPTLLSGEWPLRSPDEALARFKASSHLASVMDKVDVRVTAVQFGWLCVPPTETQDVLFPVYEVRSSVGTEWDDRSQGIHYVAASPVSARSPKLDGSVLVWPPVVIA